VEDGRISIVVSREAGRLRVLSSRGFQTSYIDVLLYCSIQSPATGYPTCPRHQENPEKNYQALARLLHNNYGKPNNKSIRTEKVKLSSPSNVIIVSLLRIQRLQLLSHSAQAGP